MMTKNQILYKAKATIDVSYRHNLHNTVKLVVNEKFDRLLQPSFAENSKSFLTSSGELKIRTWLDKNAYFPGIFSLISFLKNIRCLFLVFFLFSLSNVGLGESVLAKLKANNTSVKPTKRICLKVLFYSFHFIYYLILILPPQIYHNLELRAHGHTKYHTEVVHEQEYFGFEPCFYGIK